MAEYEMQLLKGFNGLPFGARPEDAEQLFGKPQETEILDGIDPGETLVWHYWDNGFSLFFERYFNNRFCCVEIDAPAVLRIFGRNVFELSESEIKELFKANGFQELDEERENWGEKRISFDDAMADFYFENGKMISVNYSVIFSDDISPIIPN
ncbi:MAG: hypothetical protein Fur0041_06910 [Bacteroidia bacterium]